MTKNIITSVGILLILSGLTLTLTAISSLRKDSKIKELEKASMKQKENITLCESNLFEMRTTAKMFQIAADLWRSNYFKACNKIDPIGTNVHIWHPIDHSAPEYDLRRNIPGFDL